MTGFSAMMNWSLTSRLVVTLWSLPTILTIQLWTNGLIHVSYSRGGAEKPIAGLLTIVSSLSELCCFVERQQYRLFVRNKPSSLTKEKVELLNKVNFQWKRLEDWIDRFRDLEEYVAKNGDTLVPQLYELNPGLGIWVRNQRTQYKLFKEGKQSKLSLDRIKMLKSLDFEWNAKEAKWMASFVELGKHMRENGLGALPSYQENRRLRNWADEQRKQYRKKGPLADLTLGKQPGCRLTQKRIDLLNLLAFPWTPDDAKNLRDER